MSSLHRIGLATAAGARRHLLLFSPTTRPPPRTTRGGVLIASGAAGYAFAGWLHRRHLREETTNAHDDARYRHERHRRRLVARARG
jgi:hypothetical protein